MFDLSGVKMVKEQVNTQYLSFLSTLCVLILFSRENHASFLYAQVVLVKQCTVAWRCTVGVVLDRRVAGPGQTGLRQTVFYS